MNGEPLDKDEFLEKEANNAAKRKEDEWIKFKDEVEVEGRKSNAQKTVPEKEAMIPNFITEEERKRKKTSRRKKGLLAVVIIALAITGIYTIMERNSAINETPFFPDESVSGTDNNPETQSNGKAEEVSQAATGNSAPKVSSETQTINQAGGSVVLSIGDTFDGGIIFKVNDSGTSGMIAYSEDLGPMPWPKANTIDTEIGEGWRLPTIEELSAMYENIGPGGENSGRFSDELYWSATPFDASQARMVRFSDGNTTFHFNNSAEYRKFLVRPVRDFEK